MVDVVDANIIDAVLREPTQTGFFERTVQTKVGRLERQRFAWAVGMASSDRAEKYKKSLQPGTPIVGAGLSPGASHEAVFLCARSGRATA